MTQPNYIKVDETFFPGHQINDPKWFAGRKAEIQKSVQALSRKGCSLIIYGERGTGKTSLVEMVKMIAQGNDNLLYRHKLHQQRPHKKFDFKIASVTCDADTNNIEKVLQRLITSPLGLKSFLETRIAKIERKSRDDLSINLLNIFKLGTSDEDRIIRESINETSVFETFCNVIHAIQKSILENSEQLLIVIDELDLVEDKSKLSSLIKNLSQENVKFLLSGIAKDYSELVVSHQSVVRQFAQGRIKVEPMSPDEVDGIFDLATKNNSEMIIFNKPFRDEVKDLSEGNPYFVQLCGQMALDRFVEMNGFEKKGTINTQHLNQGLEKLVEHEPVLDNVYYALVGEYPEREIMLKGIASQKAHKVRVSEVYNFCEKRGVKYPKKVLTYLLGFRDREFNKGGEKILERIGDDFVSYEQTLFKIFVKIKKPIYDWS